MRELRHARRGAGRRRPCGRERVATAPEYGRCLAAEKNAKKEYTGVYSDAGCTKEVPVSERPKKGKFNWVPGVGKGKFTSTGGVGVLTTVGGSGVECTNESAAANSCRGNNKEEAGVVVHFTGCKSLGSPCTTPGAASGELITNELEGIVGWENKARKKTDLELYPAKSVTSGLFIEFSCLGLVVKVRGHVLVPDQKRQNEADGNAEIRRHKRQTETRKMGRKLSKSRSSKRPSKAARLNRPARTITSTLQGEEKLELNAVV